MNQTMRNMISDGFDAAGEDCDIVHNFSFYDFEPKAEYAYIESKAEYEIIVQEIANTAGVDTKAVKIMPCLPVGEDCIYINGKWSGYVEEWREQGHVHNYQLNRGLH